MKGVSVQEFAAPRQVPASAPQIVARVEAVPVKELPNFTPPPQPQAAKAAPVQGEVPVVPSSVAVRPLVDIVCNVFNSRLREVSTGRPAAPQPPAPISDEEKKALSDVYGALADKWLPTIMQRWGIEAACLVTTLAVFGPRIWDWWDYRSYQKKLLAAKKEAAPAVAGQRFGDFNGGDQALKDAYERSLKGGGNPAVTGP